MVRSSRVGSRAASLLTLALTIAIAGSAELSAHRRDEYLQAARLAIDPGAVHIELDLTPGIALADAIIADIDRDRDGSLSPAEQQAYGRLVLGALHLEVDGEPVNVQLAASTFPDTHAMNRGEGTIRLETMAMLPRLSNGSHRLWFRNQHRPERSVYLANAMVPESDRIAIRAQRRDGDQRELVIEYAMLAAPALSTTVWLFGGIAATVLLLVWMVWISARQPGSIALPRTRAARSGSL